tara:strand:- start:49 stop:363 length:315 start_codon:yes stop_codon:yes gene_type:complete
MILSCGTSKQIEAEVSETDTVSDVVEKTRIVGTVRVTDIGCKLYIDASENDGSTFKIYPENLDEMFQKEGMHLKFYYDKSETAIPDDCNADMCATLSDVTPLRN